MKTALLLLRYRACFPSLSARLSRGTFKSLPKILHPSVVEARITSESSPNQIKLGFSAMILSPNSLKSLSLTLDTPLTARRLKSDRHEEGSGIFRMQAEHGMAAAGLYFACSLE